MTTPDQTITKETCGRPSSVPGYAPCDLPRGHEDQTVHSHPQLSTKREKANG